MGTWGIDSFDNDTAADWAYTLEGSDDLSVIRAAVDAIFEAAEAYIDVDVACEAIAAIDTITRLKGNWGQRNAYTETVDRWVETHRVEVPAELLDRAPLAIDLILGDTSELSELWEETDENDTWRENLATLKQRLED